LASLRVAAEALEARLGSLTVSSVYESRAVDLTDQGDFLNAVVLARSSEQPAALLGLIRELESAAGRERSVAKGPRTLDVDLVFLGDRILREPDLVVPHPRWRGRSFVVLPLLEIAPGLRDPETGWTVAEVARGWPMEPDDTRVVYGVDAIRPNP
jgi:2-amino-4-hydroxy-6-hydroxymethyldihydropteridine diphosphokinase